MKVGGPNGRFDRPESGMTLIEERFSESLIELRGEIQKSPSFPCPWDGPWPYRHKAG